ncbi:hypothetical protein GGI01_003098 [Coemansia sp. RSA 376]|nr:hypothetical protein H4S03_005828 [Coemansia sp. S3946]KAJ2073958.1 hypothetical protein GGH13_001641 [Coemansia sp. S155-1]KAJ2114967.1 hypothetical protein IW146_002682 [Coemansia sp. RSA 922]KAJ2260278.1 hypothetical protein GGI01_003098 [Coemansia sp. RSA 376]
MADTDDLDDIHGFFQFANVSDSEDDDGLFVSAKPRTVEFDVHAINYTPKIDEDEWFDHSQTTDVDDWINTHTGMDEVTFTVQNLYFKGEYGRAVDICKQAVVALYKKHGPNMRVAFMRELLEIGAKSAIRIEDLDNLEYFYDWYEQCGGKNPGYCIFRAEALTKLRRLDQALEQHIEYLDQRRLDAQVWELIGELLVSIGDTKPYSGTGVQTSWLRLALGAFFVSHSVIRGCKGWRSSELAIKRKQLQTEQLLKHATETLRKVSPGAASASSGSDCEVMVWELCKTESTLDEASQQHLLQSCTDRLATCVKWIFAHLSLGSLDDVADEDDEEKNAADL